MEPENPEQIAKAIAAQFGSNCEVVLHELSGKSAYSSIVAIENGHVTGRKVGDGPSHVVLEQLGHEDDNAEDQLGYLTRTKDGKILKSSSVYIRDETGKRLAKRDGSTGLASLRDRGLSAKALIAELRL